jgi:beta-N-acetylhexosaminidase
MLLLKISPYGRNDTLLQSKRKTLENKQKEVENFVQKAPKDSSKVSLEEKIGQMILVGFRGTSLSEDSKIIQQIKAGKIGSVILFDKDLLLKSQRNIQSKTQVSQLNHQLQSAATKIPLFISVDQEGGKVCRLKKEYGFLPTVSAEYLGRRNKLDSTYYYSDRLARELEETGFNVNFAPDVDVNTNPTNPAIGKLQRSFSPKAEIVAEHAAQVIDAHHAHHVLTAIKHFPGHGSAYNDSHLGVTDVSNTWKPLELLPYKTLISQGKCDFIMTAHIFNRNLDPDVPATLSKKVITGILRDSLHYQGVVISDDLQMKAISSVYRMEETVEKSINAGVDILLFGNNLDYDEEIPEKVINIVKKLISEGKISEERINESYNRIMALKAGLKR